MFSFFAIVTSFLGVGLGCVDFIADLMRSGGPLSGVMKRNKKNPIVNQGLPLLTAIVPPTIVAQLAPGIFYAALEFSGTFRLILFGLIPTMMASVFFFNLLPRQLTYTYCEFLSMAIDACDWTSAGVDRAVQAKASSMAARGVSFCPFFFLTLSYMFLAPLPLSLEMSPYFDTHCCYAQTTCVITDRRNLHECDFPRVGHQARPGHAAYACPIRRSLSLSLCCR